jgi:hypothetical protein
MKFNIVKWRLMLTTLPLTIFLFVIKLGLLYGLHFEGLIKFSEVGIVVTGGLFLIGFMLAGVMADYKESEKMPGELACSLETMEDTIILAYGFKPAFDVKDLRDRLRSVTVSIINYFERQHNEEVVLEKINTITDIARVMENAAIGPICSRMSGEQNNLRKLFTRVSVIRNTNFLSTGYALMEVLTFTVFGLLMVSKFDSLLVMAIIVCSITQIFVYMIRLIKDIDQPYEYSASGVARAADVDLFPLLEYHKRSQARMA